MALLKRKKLWRAKRKNLLQILLLTIISVVILHIFWQVIAKAIGADNRFVADIAFRLGLDNEQSIPTWLASSMALILAGLAFIVAKAQGTASKKAAWYILSLIALAVSIDETAALHELLLQGLHILAQFGEGQTFLSNAWIIVLPFVFIALLFILRFFKKTMEPKTFRRLCVGVGVYLLGAAVFEYASIQLDKSTLSYNIGIVVAEETLELLGMWLLIRATLLHISEFEPKLRKQLTELVDG